jgi:hypothetical protein
VELQELSLKSVRTQLRFKPTARFADVRGHITEELSRTHDLSEWGWGDAFVHVFSPDRTTNLVVSGRELQAGFEQIHRLDDLRESMAGFFEFGLETLGVDEVIFLGIRTYWIAAVDSFDELRAWLIESLSQGVDPLLEPFGGSPSDVGWTFEFHQKDPKHSIRFGPMKQAQLVEQILATNSTEGIPLEFLFVDLDRFYNDGPIEARSVPERWNDSFQRSLDLGAQLGRIVATGFEAS